MLLTSLKLLHSATTTTTDILQSVTRFPPCVCIMELLKLLKTMDVNVLLDYFAGAITIQQQFGVLAQRHFDTSGAGARDQTIWTLDDHITKLWHKIGKNTHRSSGIKSLEYWAVCLVCFIINNSHPLGTRTHLLTVALHWTKRQTSWLHFRNQKSCRAKLSRSRAAEKKPNSGRQNECRRHSSGLLTVVAAKCQMVDPAGRWCWLGEHLQVSLLPSLVCLSSVWCWARGTTPGRAVGYIIRGGQKNRLSSRGKQQSRLNLADIILRAAAVAVFGKGDFWPAHDKTVGFWKF